MTLKRYITLAGLIFSAFIAPAQNFNNIEFIENKGQWDNRIKYKGDVDAGAFFIRSGGFTVLQHNKADLDIVYENMHGHDVNGKMSTRNQKLVVRSHAFMVDFIGASPDMQVIPDKLIPTYNNYIQGNDPSKWAGNCRIFQAITLKNIYPNVDVRYYTDNGMLKYDIIVKPGADISRIALKYEGADKLLVKNKELIVGTSIGELRESSPYTYQVDGMQKTEVACKYIVKDNIVRFDIKNYDRNATLVIDPTLIYCSFSGSSANNWGYTATYGPDGSTYGGGIVFDNGFPTSPGAFQTTYQGGIPGSDTPVDIGIIKLSPNGNNRVYATYVGGSGNDQPHSLIVDGQGNLIIAGRTNSSNYPVTGVKIGPAGITDHDILVTKLNAAGSALIGSRKIGGTNDDGVNIKTDRAGTSSLEQNYGDDGRSEVLLDGAGNIYIASCTQSANFPAVGAVFQNSFGGGTQDGVVIKLNATLSGNPLFSSFLGGSSNDAAYVLAISPGGDIFVGGGTESSGASFPGNHAGTVGPAPNGSIDGFIAQISNDGSSIIRSAFIGTAGIDQVYGVQFDRNGFPYIMGQTRGTWQVVNAAFSNPGGKQFIAKLQPNLSAYIYSTVFGTGSAFPNISPVAFLVDRCENVYVSGWGGSIGSGYPSGGTTGLQTTSDAIKLNTDNSDFYFFVLRRNAAGPGPLYASFFGQNGGLVDHVDGGTSRFDQNGVIYQAICANCENASPNPTVFPTTPGSWSTTKPSTAFCNLAMVKIAFNLAGVAGSVHSAINGIPNDSAGCVPLTVVFSDTIQNAQTYEWHFNYVPGNPPDLITTVPTATHTYTAIGNYLVMLVAVDPNTCNIRDSSFINIRVGDLQATVDFNPVKLPPCDSFKYRFDNLSVPPPTKPFGPQSFIWDFGDGSPRITTGAAPVFHNYAAPGTYNVRLILNDTSYCNSPDSITFQLRVAANVKAQFTTPPTGCAPYNAVFNNTSLAGQTFEWDFGDGGTSTAVSPTHLYATAGIYNVVLVANDPNTCNLTDTARFTITVYDLPVPDFSHAPDPPLENTPTTFTNLSSPDAIRFKWDFGDGDSLLTTSRAPVQHQYNATATFTACLTAYNAANCDSTICKQVTTLVIPAVDVPNAFTPQSGDVNSVVMVRGFGIVKMQFIIWNRWGQKVFESNSQSQGWNGKVKGVVQPMDVYAYTLSIEFFDGTKANKKGDLTLIR